jgi:CheY-like chemotaxis protein
MMAKHSVLLVEDSPDDAEIAKIAFEKTQLDINLEVVKTGRSAILRLQEVNQPDLVILDWNLPLVSGKEVLFFIKRTARIKRIPVVVLTTSKNTQDITDAYDGHCNAYTVKPLEFDDTIELLSSIANFYCRYTLSPKEL